MNKPIKQKRFGLSKSRIQIGLRCPKSLYLEVHKPELAAPHDDQTLSILNQGTEVGIFARTLFPGGILIEEGPRQSKEALERTQEVMQSGAKVIFEAAIVHEGTLVRIDVLERKKVGSPWNLIEVKQGTKHKDSHTMDAATQTLVARRAGLEIGKVSILHLSADVPFDPEDPEALFTYVDVTTDAKQLLGRLTAAVSEFSKVLEKKVAPVVEWAEHCTQNSDAGYQCKFFEHCKKSAGVPTPSVFDLRRISAWKHYREGHIRLNQLTGVKLSDQNMIILKAHQTKRAHIDKAVIRKMIEGWEHPIHALDFETFTHKIPKFKGARVDDKIPFQFSAYIAGAKGDLREMPYLHPDGSDPRRLLPEALLAAFPKKGSIAAFNADFEKRCILLLAQHNPKLAKDLKDLAGRFVDPYPVLEKGYYHPGFNFKFRLKMVAPVILGKAGSYKWLKIQSGAAIQAIYDEYVNPNCPPKRQEQLKKDLLLYCGQDSKVTIGIVKWLFKISEEKK